MTQTVQPFSAYTKRILLLLQDDTDIKAEIKEWRRGELGIGIQKNIHASNYPLAYITTAPKPEVERLDRGTATSPSDVPLQERIFDLWVVLVVQADTAEAAQDKIYDLAHKVRRVLESHTQLRKPDETDPLCLRADVEMAPRLEATMGTPIEGMTIRMRIHTAAE